MQLKTEKIEIQKVENVNLLYYPNTSYLTNIQILTKVGSAAEIEGEHGLAHILEHMFFKGSKKNPGGTAISRAANNIGAKMNAYTTYDHTVYYISVLNDVFEEGFEILADMYTQPLFPQEEFNKELNPILSELREREDDPDNFIMERAFAQYFGQSYHPVIGTEQSIRDATVEGMHQFRKNFYGGENCLVSIAGGISLEAALACTKKFFGNDMHHSIQKPKIESLTYKAGEITLKKAGIREAYWNLFFPALEAEHPDRFKQDMMSYLLGGNDSALLFERIREELGMSCYGIYSWVMRNKPFHALGISCGIAVEELDQLDREVQLQIDRICNERLSEERLNRGKASLRASIAARAETSAGINSMIAVPILFGEEGNPLQNRLEQLENITLSDIQEAAQKTLNGHRLKAILLPE